MILAKSWWDSGGSEATFLVVGAALTIVASYLAERAKHKREQDRRSAEWQRVNLLDLQDSFATAIDDLVVAVHLTQLRHKADPTLSFDACTGSDQMEAMHASSMVVQRLASRVLDDDLRQDVMKWFDAVGQVDGAQTFDEQEQRGAAVLEITREVFPKVGQLLRRQYS